MDMTIFEIKAFASGLVAEYTRGYDRKNIPEDYKEKLNNHYIYIINRTVKLLESDFYYVSDYEEETPKYLNGLNFSYDFNNWLKKEKHGYIVNLEADSPDIWARDLYIPFGNSCEAIKEIEERKNLFSTHSIFIDMDNRVWDVDQNQLNIPLEDYINMVKNANSLCIRQSRVSGFTDDIQLPKELFL